MEELKVIQFKDFKNILDKEDATSEEIQALTDDLMISSYISINDKTMILMEFFNNVYDSNVAAITVNQFETMKLFGILLAYSNIVVEADDLTMENYDWFMMNNLDDIILEVCYRDYERFIQMFESMININGMLSLNASLDNINSDEVATNLKAIEDLFKGLDPDVLESLSTISTMADPSTHEIVEKIKEQAIEDIKDNVKQITK